jgi:hypothetical protein
MTGEIVTPDQAESRIPWLPFLFMAIGVVMALILLIYTIFTTANLYLNSNDLQFVLSVFYGLSTPFILLGVALFLIILTESTKGRATWSKMIFFYGAFLFVIGAVFAIAMQFEFIYNENWAFNSDLIEYLGLGANVLNLLGTMLCAIAILSLVKAYLKGEIQLKHGYLPTN